VLDFPDAYQYGTRMRKLVILMAFALNGCAAPLVGALTIDQAFSAFSLASSLLTGKSFGEYAMDAATGDDCRLLEAVVRTDRKFCEPKGSPQTADDYKGVRTLAGYLAETDNADLLTAQTRSLTIYDGRWYRNR